MPDAVPVTLGRRCRSPADDEHPHEECGVLGLSTPHGEGVAQLAFFGLYALQHRGQEAAGIAVSDGTRARTAQGVGPRLAGVHARARWRRSPATAPSATPATAPPAAPAGTQRPAVPRRDDARSARRRPQRQPRQRQRAARGAAQPRLRPDRVVSDTEVLTLMLAAAGGRTWEERVERTMPAWKGAYSLVLLANDRVIAVRDPWGFRPLSVGRLPVGRLRRRLRDVRARAPSAASRSTRSAPARSSRCRAPRCAARSCSPRRCARRAARSSSSTSRRPDSVWDGHSVHHVRQRLGEELAVESGVDADVVDPGARHLDPGRHRLLPPQRHPVQRRSDQEPLHRPHVHRADPDDARARRGVEVQRARREPQRQARGA